MRREEYSEYFGGECPICGKLGVNVIQSSNGNKKFIKRTNKIICDNAVCVETAKHFEFFKRVRSGHTVPKDYFLFGQLTRWDESVTFRDSWFSTLIFWNWRNHTNEIQRKRREVMALMYLNGKIELSEEAIPYLDKNFCKPIKYKQTIKRFSYETHKSNFDTLRNYGWSDLLLSGVTPTRSKSSKHAKHH